MGKERIFSRRVSDQEIGLKLRTWLKEQSGWSNAKINHCIDVGKVRRNGRVERFGTSRLNAGDTVTWSDLEHEKARSEAVEKDIPVLFLGDNELVVNKPAGLPSQTTPDRSRPSVESMVEKISAQRAWGDVFLAHRLDRDTTGVLLFARGKENLEAWNHLFRERAVQKTYRALVHGRVPFREAVWKHRLGPGERLGGVQKYTPVGKGGLAAVTDVESVELMGNCSLLELRPHTGRTHQLRVQCLAAGFPIVGDELYDPQYRDRQDNPSHQLLHALRLNCVERELRVEAPLPQEFMAVLDRLKKSTGKTRRDSPD